MFRIDYHQHFWKFDPVRDTWIGEDMPVLRRDFLPDDLGPILEQQGLQGSIAVQSDQSPAENAFQLDHAGAHPFIKGVVGWVNLEADDIEEQLAFYHGFPALKGFRHVLQGEPQRDFMLRPGFTRGISRLNRYGFTYDILIYPDQLSFSCDLVRRFPDQLFVLDHLGKPPIGTLSPATNGQPTTSDATEGLLRWKKEIQNLAASGNVFCKVSGMVTEAHWGQWKKEDFRPYLDTVVEAFGMKRLMFGSDWPVCLLSATYGETIDIVEDYFAAFSSSEKAGLFGGNAATFYHIS